MKFCLIIGISSGIVVVHIERIPFEVASSLAEELASPCWFSFAFVVSHIPLAVIPSLVIKYKLLKVEQHCKP